MLAFTGGLFAGIFGIFPFSKKSEYLLVFQETKETNTPKEESTQTTVAEAPTETEAPSDSSEAPKEAKPEIAAATKEEKNPAAKAVTKETQAAKEAEKVELQKSTTPQVVTPETPITNGTTSQKQEEVVLFSPNLLMLQLPTKRRRPGPSMSMFLNIAKGMNLSR